MPFSQTRSAGRWVINTRLPTFFYSWELFMYNPVTCCCSYCACYRCWRHLQGHMLLVVSCWSCCCSTWHIVLYKDKPLYGRLRLLNGLLFANAEIAIVNAAIALQWLKGFRGWFESHDRRGTNSCYFFFEASEDIGSFEWMKLHVMKSQLRRLKKRALALWCPVCVLLHFLLSEIGPLMASDVVAHMNDDHEVSLLLMMARFAIAAFRGVVALCRGTCTREDSRRLKNDEK